VPGSIEGGQVVPVGKRQDDAHFVDLLTANYSGPVVDRVVAPKNGHDHFLGEESFPGDAAVDGFGEVFFAWKNQERSCSVVSEVEQGFSNGFRR